MMKQKSRWLSVGAIVGILLLVVAGSVLALDRWPAAPSAAPDMGREMAVQQAMTPARLCGRAGLEAAAQALHMTPEELRVQLWGGRTLAELADRAGVDLQDVYTAVQGACEKPLREAIERAVSNGRISREEGDWLLEGLDKGYWGPRAQNPFIRIICQGHHPQGRGPGGRRAPLPPGGRP